jgi:hypothetical protein
MFERDGLLPGDGTAWLLAIGRRLRAEYAALEEPIPERLTALLAQLEKQSNGTGQDTYVRLPMKSGSSPRPHILTHRYWTAVNGKAI